jgi:hypothetical protein
MIPVLGYCIGRAVGFVRSLHMCIGMLSSCFRCNHRERHPAMRSALVTWRTAFFFPAILLTMLLVLKNLGSELPLSLDSMCYCP